MPLSWNEIRSRAIRFSKEWENVIEEDAEAKTFLDQFFDVFGISRRRVASFEHRDRKVVNKSGYGNKITAVKIQGCKPLAVTSL